LEVLKLKDGTIYIDRKKVTVDGEIIFSPKFKTTVSVGFLNSKLFFNESFSGKQLNVGFEVEDIMTVSNHVYAKNGDKIMEIVLNEIGNSVIPSVKQTVNVMPKATTLFSNVIYQDVLGVPYFSLPKPSDYGLSSLFVLPVKELEGHKIIGAKYLNRILIVTAYKDNSYSRFILRFSENHTDYDCRIISDISHGDINFTVLDNGICVIIQPDDSLEVIFNDPKISKIRRFENVDSAMRLTKSGNKVLFFKGNKLFSLSLK